MRQVRSVNTCHQNLVNKCYYFPVICFKIYTLCPDEAINIRTGRKPIVAISEASLKQTEKSNEIKK